MTEIALNQLRSKFSALIDDFSDRDSSLDFNDVLGPSQAFFVGFCGVVIIQLPDEHVLNMSTDLRLMLGLKKMPKHFGSLRALTHPEAKVVGRNHFNKCVALFRNSEDARPFKIKAGHCLRMRNANGEYVSFYRQFFPMTYDDQNELSHMLVVYTDISHISPKHYDNLSVTGLKGKRSRYPGTGAGRRNQSSSNYDLTERELQVLRLVAKNFSSTKIAEKLFLSPHTVKIHRKNLLRKTKTNSSLELVMLAKDEGWI